MKFLGKTLGLLLASLTLASCGGGGSSGANSAPQSGSITLTADRTTLPLNSGGELPFLGSPFLASVSVTFRSANGTIEAPNGDGTFTIDQPNIATLSQADDPATTDVNEFTQRYASFHQTMNNGSFTVFVNSLTTAGTAILTVSAVDPQTGVTVTKTLGFTVSSGVGTQPATVSLVANPTNVYLAGAGGSSSSQISVQVLDGAGLPVPNPASGNAGFDNVQFDIVGDSGGATLSTISASGNVSGPSVQTHTLNGIASATFTAGTLQGPIHLKVTADRSDNNVTNGIADPVTSTGSVIVSDGKLASIIITSPSIDSLQVNPPVASGVTSSSDATPPPPDGTYSLTVSALAVDSQGAPVTVGTPIAFGTVDAPLIGFPDQGTGQFAIQGGDGNPQESGTLFTAPTGQFTTAGGGAGPGDTLLVFGKEVSGNDDLESARVIAHVNSATSLNVTRPFNPNDHSGTIDYGPVLRYVIGRATESNITPSASTDVRGVATVQLTYPVSRLGKAVYIWAQADGGVTPAGGTRLVSDISGFNFAGEAPATLSASPSPIAGNTTTNVTVCLQDARTEALQGVAVGFAFQGVAGQATLDGQPASGFFSHPTGIDGCVTGEITTTGIAAAGAASIQFTAGTLTPITVPISPVGSGLLLQVSPSGLPPSGGSVVILLTGSDGSPQAGVGISVVCTGGVSSSIPSATNADGRSAATITNAGTAGGTCVYSAGGTGGPTATVTVTAPPTDTTPPTTPAQVALTLVVVPPAGGTGPYSVSVAGGGSCSATTTTQTCPGGSFDVGSVLTLTANVAPTAWTGSCVVSPTDPTKATVTLAAASSCTAHF